MRLGDSANARTDASHHILIVSGACYQLIPRRLLRQHIFEMVCSCPEKRSEDAFGSHGRAFQVIYLGAKVDEQHRPIGPALILERVDNFGFCRGQVLFNLILGSLSAESRKQ